MSKFGFLKSLAFWRWFGFGVAVVASRSAKVRRVMGKIENWHQLLQEIEEMARQRGGQPLPFEGIRREFGLSLEEAQQFACHIKEYGLAHDLALVISGVPPGTYEAPADSSEKV